MADKPTPTPSFPLRATMAAAFRDSFGNIPQFLRVISVLWICTLVFVDVPSLYLAETINRSVIAELVKKEGTAPSEETGTAETAGTPPAPKVFDQKALEKLTRDDVRNAVKIEYMFINMLLSLVQVIFIFGFVVAWYQALLLGEKQGKPILPRVGKAEWDFAWTSMKVGFVLCPIFIILVGFIAAGMPEFAADSGGQDIRTTIPLVIICIVLMLYLQARLSMCYPLTIVGQKEEVLKKSWKMTGKYGLQILGGSILVCLPVILLTTGVIMGVAQLFQLVGFNPVPGLMAEGTPIGSHISSLVLRGLGGFFTYVMLAVLSAFHARVYAFFVRGGGAA